MNTTHNTTSSSFYPNNETNFFSFNFTDVLKSTGNPGMVSACVRLSSQECGLAIGNYLAYEIPKKSLESTCSWILWAGKQIGKGLGKTIEKTVDTTKQIAAQIYSAPSTVEKISQTSPQLADIFSQQAQSISQGSISTDKIAEASGEIKQILAQVLPSETETSEAIHNISAIVSPISQPINEKGEALYEKAEDYYGYAAQQLDALSSRLTDQLIGKSTEGKNQEDIDNSQDSFKAIDLIGPALFLTFCANQTAKHLNKAFTHAATLFSGTRTHAKLYQVKAGENVILVTNTKQYTTPKLMRDTAMHMAFSGIAGVAAYCAYNGIYNTLEKASGNSAHATNCVRTIFLVCTMAPKIFNWGIKKTKKALAAHGSPVNAPNFFYTQPLQEVKKNLVGRYEDTNTLRYSHMNPLV